MRAENIKDIIILIADERDISPYKLSKISGLSTSAVFSYYRGSTPNLSSVQMLCDGLQVSLPEIWLYGEYLESLVKHNISDKAPDTVFARTEPRKSISEMTREQRQRTFAYFKELSSKK